MGLKTPFSPAGTCETCRFSSPIDKKKHYLGEYYPMFCHRFPPTGPVRAYGGSPWNSIAPVSKQDFCAEYKKED